jgi:hypothetical protein
MAFESRAVIGGLDPLRIPVGVIAAQRPSLVTHLAAFGC